MKGVALMQTTKSMPGLKWFWWLPLFFLIDQISKWLVLKNISYGETVALFPSLQLTLAHNHGIAFSMLSTQQTFGQIALISFIVLICAAISVWLAKTPMEEKWSGFSLALILGGALGNLCDRIWHGYVVDFIDFYVQSWHWYTFNIADAFITIGALMSIKTVLFAPTEKT